MYERILRKIGFLPTHCKDQKICLTKKFACFYAGARFESPEILIYITSSNSDNEKELTAAVEELHFSGIVVNAVSIT